MKLFIRLLLIAILGLVATSFSSSAQDNNPNYLIINPLVTIASYQSTPLSDVLLSTDVITQDEIATSSATSFGELISQKTGIEVTRSGGPGAQTSVFLRGQSSVNYVLLIDGIRVQTDEWANLRPMDLPLDSIEKIEVLKGNASALYGDAAIGGVINIITKSGTLRDGGYGSITYGSQATKAASASLSQKIGGVDVSISATTFETEGLDATKSSDFDKDEFERSNHSISLSKRLSPKTKLEAKYKSSQSKGGLDGYYDRLNTNNIDYTFSAIHNNRGLLNARFDLNTGKLNYDSFHPSNPNNNQIRKGKQSAFKLVNISYLGDDRKTHTLTQGLEHSDAEYHTTSRDGQAIFLGYSLQLGSHTLQTNIRKDEINVQNEGSPAKRFNAASWLVGYGYRFSPNFKASLTQSTGFRAPSAGEYSYNSDLKAEEHVSTEFSIQHANKQSLSRMTLFSTDTNNGIQSWPVENMEKLKNQGVEFSLNRQSDFASYRLSLTFQDPKIKNGASAIKSRLKRAKTYANMSISKSLGNYNFNGKLSYSGRRHDVSNATMKSYIRVDASLSQQLTPATLISLKAENITDADYETTAGYNTPGRSLFLTLKYNFATAY